MQTDRNQRGKIPIHVIERRAKIRTRELVSRHLIPNDYVTCHSLADD